MTRSRPNFVAAEAEAKRLLRELGLTTLPVDPFDVARRLDMELRPLPSNAGGASGMLLRSGEHFGICYPTHVPNDGFVRFSVAHEIGHYRLPGHVDAVLANGQHRSHAEFQSADRYEREADHFAAALLMPASLFKDAMTTAGDGVDAIEILAETARTSLEATAVRFVELADEPVAVVRSARDRVEYCTMSSPLKDFPEIDWIRRGMPLPPDTATAAFNADPAHHEDGGRDEGKSDFQDWFNGPHRQEIVEEVIGLGSYGKTLTVLTGMEHPDWLEDDEGELERSWTPRFR